MEEDCYKFDQSLEDSSLAAGQHRVYSIAQRNLLHASGHSAYGCGFEDHGFATE